MEPIIIVGAGLAGCWLARLLAERGVRVSLLEQRPQVGLGASGNPAGILKPYVTRSPSLAMDFHVKAHACLLRLLRHRPALMKAVSGENGNLDMGVLQLVERAYSPSSHYQSINPTQSSRLAGTALNSHALYFEQAGWLNPSALCRALIQHPSISLTTHTQITAVTPRTEHGKQTLWQLSIAHHTERWARRLILASGASLSAFPQTSALPIIPARGQMSRFALRTDMTSPQCIINGKHYLIPDKNTILVGATFDRHSIDEQVSHEDHKQNLIGLHAMLPSLHVHHTALAGYAGVRATTPDRLPIVGPAPDLNKMDSAYADLKHGRRDTHYPTLPCWQGLFLLGGLGSRGIVTAPMAAELLLNHLRPLNNRDEENPTTDWTPLLNPARFRIRDLKKGKIRGA